jgi:hypothetical protein
MPIQFKFRDSVDDERRREIVDVLGRAGFSAQSLFPGQKRPQLASIFTVTNANANDLKTLQAALTDYGREIEYVETAPERKLRT